MIIDGGSGWRRMLLHQSPPSPVNHSKIHPLTGRTLILSLILILHLTLVVTLIVTLILNLNLIMILILNLTQTVTRKPDFH